jgi:putative addiction module component (TIGR02574 family)
MGEVGLRLKDEVLKLPPQERIEVARAVWDSLDNDTLDEIEEADFLAELERRSLAADAGLETEQDFREAIEELRREKP